MNQSPHDFLETVASEHIDMLNLLIGQIITEITRYSWFPPDEAAEEYEWDETEAFFFTAGAVLITFHSGVIIGFASQPSLASVTCWMERDSDGNWRGKSEQMNQDPELFPISATDPTYSTPAASSIIGDKLSEISIWVRPPKNARLEDLPREVGVRLVGDQGEDLWFAHGLHGGSDDFEVLKWDHIEQSLRAILTQKLSIK